MDVIWEELTYGLTDARQLIHVVIKLSAAALLGAVIGYQRELAGKPAGIRTHILATLGTTVFVVACHSAGFQADALSRIIQGIITGIGFLGAGAILKLDENIKGLTTAASIWTAAAIGIAVGLGALGVALIATIFALVVLTILGAVEIRTKKDRTENLPETE